MARSESLTPRRVSEVLGCSLKTVYRKIHSGKLPAFRLDENGELRIAVVDLLAFRERNKYRKPGRRGGRVG